MSRARIRAHLGSAQPDLDAIGAHIRRQPVLASHWHEVWAAENVRAFSIAGLYRLDILGQIHQRLLDVLQGNLSRSDWLDAVSELLSDAGVLDKFNEKRLRLIFDTSIAHATAAGRWQRLWESRDVHPYLMYVTKQDDRVRPAHAAWHGLVLPIEHPFWSTHFPPNGFRCRCAVIGVSEKEYRRLRTGEINSIAGQRVRLQAPREATIDAINTATGEIHRVPAGVTPGFHYNPGIDPGYLRERIHASQETLPESIVEASRQDIADAVQAAAEIADHLQEIAAARAQAGLPDLPEIAPGAALAPAAGVASNTLSADSTMLPGTSPEAPIFKDAADATERIPGGQRWLKIDGGVVRVLEEIVAADGSEQHRIYAIPLSIASQDPHIAELLRI